MRIYAQIDEWGAMRFHQDFAPPGVNVGRTFWENATFHYRYTSHPGGVVQLHHNYGFGGGPIAGDAIGPEITGISVDNLMVRYQSVQMANVGLFVQVEFNPGAPYPDEAYIDGPDPDPYDPYVDHFPIGQYAFHAMTGDVEVSTWPGPNLPGTTEMLTSWMKSWPGEGDDGYWTAVTAPLRYEYPHQGVDVGVFSIAIHFMPLAPTLPPDGDPPTSRARFT